MAFKCGGGKSKGYSYINNAYNSIAESTTTNANEITKITYTSNGREMRLYRNGEQVGSSSIANGKIEMPDSNTRVMLGGNPKKTSIQDQRLNGNIYLIRLYDRTLTADEVKQNYNIDNKNYNINSEYYDNLTFDDSSYKIENATQLNEFRAAVDGGNTFNGKYVELTADINLSSISNWNPIGSDSIVFNGIFNGNGHKITNLNVNNNTTYQGLFARVGANGVVERLTIESGTIKGTERVGAIAGQNQGVITNCTNKATVNTTGVYTGGITGVNWSGIVQRCTNTGSVTSSNTNLGGIVGRAGGAGNLIKFCTNSATQITGSNYVGGIVGYVYNSGVINSCANTGKVKSTAYTSSNNNCVSAGIVGWIGDGSKATFCKNSGAVENAGSEAGGIICVGNNATISYCYNTGTLKVNRTSSGGYRWYGGISSENQDNCKIYYCYNSGSFTSSNGRTGGIVANQYKAGSVMDHCYWLSTTASNAYGTKSAGTVSNCAKKTDAEMKADALISLLGGTGYWQKVTNGYPKLYWE